MKLSKTDCKERRELVEAIAAADEQVRDEHAALLKQLGELPGKLNAAIAAYNSRVAEAKVFAERVAGDLRGEYDDRSERWQESDAGQAALSLVEEWEEFDADEREPVQLVEPDEAGDSCHTTLDDLPAES